jgi:hypothetical protein
MLLYKNKGLKMQTIKESIPETVEGLELFIKACSKEINKYARLQEIAQKMLDLKSGKTKPKFGLSL